MYIPEYVYVSFYNFGYDFLDDLGWGEWYSYLDNEHINGSLVKWIKQQHLMILIGGAYKTYLG